ncbi:hypothetical protein [Mycobacterium phage WXIN]|nr:hypothetical protein [Mycobacterium phage WXIN]
MPKEIIQRPGSDAMFPETEMSVHWDKDGGYVQIGVTRHAWTEPVPDAVASPIHADHQHCHECALTVERNEARRAEYQRREYAEMVAFGRIGSPEPAVCEFDPPATVFTKPMTRGEINNLIRVLRRARDQAHGQDA